MSAGCTLAVMGDVEAPVATGGAVTDTDVQERRYRYRWMVALAIVIAVVAGLSAIGEYGIGWAFVAALVSFLAFVSIYAGVTALFRPRTRE